MEEINEDYNEAIIIVADTIIDLGCRGLDGYVKEILSAVHKENFCESCISTKCTKRGIVLSKCSSYYNIPNMFLNLYTIDALLSLRNKNVKMLDKASNRKLTHAARDYAERLDGNIPSLKTKLEVIGIKNKLIHNYFTRMRKIKITNAKAVSDKWDKKFNLITALVKKCGFRLKDLIKDDTVLKLIKSYKKDDKSALRLINRGSKYLEKDITSISKGVVAFLKSQ